MPCPFHDPFKKARQDDGILINHIQGEDIPMVLRHADVREAAKDWRTFSSNASHRVPIPSEEDLRPMRQLPIETDPPEHTAYRKIVEPFFKRAKLPEVIAKVEALVDRLLSEALTQESIEAVRDFALPLQSTALTYLLNVAESEAETWIGWGTHVFNDGDGATKGTVLDTYLRQRLAQAAQNPGDDLFSALLSAEYQGRKLTHEEAMGFANLTFAGGRDTVIHTITSTLDYLCNQPDQLAYLSEDPKHIIAASEELFRVMTPLTHIGRVCPVATDVQGQTVPADGRMSLGWAAANFDPAVFDSPEEVQLDRKPNPHVAFGFGTHLCLGAPHARLILRTLLQQLSERVDQINILERKEAIETAAYKRSVGFDRLVVAFSPRV
ncbi:MAG: cytochrome P450 [Opitutaceae bacterium]|jgi:cytochrome P450|nr:cytochrome P450 [Opitutaceae bacterium]